MVSMIEKYSNDLFLITWACMWIAGGWLLAARVFRLKTREQALVGISLGLVLSNWLANLTARVAPLPYAFWLSALITLALGVVLAWPLLRGGRARGLLLSVPALFITGLIALVFTAIGRGLAIFDDFQNLPTTSLLAAGDIPPHFSLNPSLRFGYHYFLLLFSAQLMRVGQMYPWNALDFARGVTIALTLALGGLWAWRLTRNRLAGLLAVIFMAFDSGTRWLLLLLPASLLQKISTHIEMLGSAAQSGVDLATALTKPWAIQGDGPLPFPFAFSNGVNAPLVMSLGGIGTMNVLILLLLLFTCNRWRHWSAGYISTILVASLALADEVLFGLVFLGFIIVVVISAIQRRSFRFSPDFLPWIAILGAGGMIALFQGGMFTEIVRGWFESGAPTPDTSYFSIAFNFIWPPAIVSGHLGTLSLGAPFQLFIALLEIGPIIFVFPLLLWWGTKMVRMQRWVQAALAGCAVASLGMIFVRLVGGGLITGTTRLLGGLFFASKIFAVPLVWVWARKRVDRLKTFVLCLGLLSVFGGIVLFGTQLIAAQKPVYSYFITVIDAQMERDYWDQLESDALVFDPVPFRAPTVFGRPTDAAFAWHRMKPEWEALVQSPDPYQIRAAGFDYVYFDILYWEKLSQEHQALLQAPCVSLVKQYDGFRSERDYRKDFRRLLDIRNCQ